ncbi:MAG: hypothetical protein JW769_02315, partial [Parachlamydiales bacterium]|nr:hypothetical protein [Parachlamydiales bacterium]
KKEKIKQKSSKALLFSCSQINPYHKKYQEMNDKLHQMYQKLDKDFQKKAPIATLTKDTQELMLLLGECNYIARECFLFEKKIKGMKK